VVADFDRRLASPAGKSRLAWLGEDSCAWLRSGLNPRLGGSRVVAAHRSPQRSYANTNVALDEIGGGEFSLSQAIEKSQNRKIFPPETSRWRSTAIPA